MSSYIFQPLFLWIWLLCSSWIPLGFGCLESERSALLLLKDSINEGGGSYLPSWKGGDCCRWVGVKCNSKTGAVRELALNATRQAELGYWYSNLTLFASLKELQRLHLSSNWLVLEGILIIAYHPKDHKLLQLTSYLCFNLYENSKSPSQFYTKKKYGSTPNHYVMV